eukprot:TRINITY_DN5083_c0_g1_i1.p1 TRINITY_DN5083_c0_g1~~TRINITY_DN5083_c0_g1_i1.p1  ORF type:complete len:222 (+),score=57.37 TRINITY_DN5083_c0_g1_i1:85-750(+)
MWKKRKEITGVSNSSIIGLKAEMAKTEQEQKRAKLTGEKVAKPLSKKTKDLYTGKAQNKGVEERNRRDVASQKADAKDWEAAEAKLREKSELYERMVRGEVMEPTFKDPDDDRSYMVDFQAKSYSDPQSSSMRPRESDEDERRQKWEDLYELEMKEEDERRERQRVAQDMNYETRKGRELHNELKAKRKAELEQRLLKLKERQQAAKPPPAPTSPDQGDQT